MPAAAWLGATAAGIAAMQNHSQFHAAWLARRAAHRQTLATPSRQGTRGRSLPGQECHRHRALRDQHSASNDRTEHSRKIAVLLSLPILNLSSQSTAQPVIDSP